jgi:hypothetical protein
MVSEDIGMLVESLERGYIERMEKRRFKYFQEISIFREKEGGLLQVGDMFVSLHEESLKVMFLKN